MFVFPEKIEFVKGLKSEGATNKEAIDALVGKIKTELDCYEVGLLLFLGLEVDEDKELGLSYIERSKDYYAKACFFSSGELIEVDEVKAVGALEEGIAQGDVNCLYYKAMCHSVGTLGYKECPDTAFKLMTRASDLGCAISHLRLGYFYEMGVGTEVDHTKAFEIYSTCNPIFDWDEFCLEGLIRYYREGIVTDKDEVKANFLTGKLKVIKELNELCLSVDFNSSEKEKYGQLVKELTEGLF